MFCQIPKKITNLTISFAMTCSIKRISRWLFAFNLEATQTNTFHKEYIGFNELLKADKHFFSPAFIMTNNLNAELECWF